MVKTRVIIYPKDVALITGRSERHGRKLLAMVRERLGKNRDQVVTVREFCEYMGLTVEEVSPWLM